MISSIFVAHFAGSVLFGVICLEGLTFVFCWAGTCVFALDLCSVIVGVMAASLASDVHGFFSTLCHQLRQRMTDIHENRIAKGKLAVWLAIEERVFSVELHLCMKGYCWRESRAKIVPIVKTKMLLVLRKYQLGNEQIYRKWMSAKFWIEIEIFRKFEETTHTQKYEKTHWRKKQNGRDERRKPNDSSCRGKPNKRPQKKTKEVSMPKRVKHLFRKTKPL